MSNTIKHPGHLEPRHGNRDGRRKREVEGEKRARLIEPPTVADPDFDLQTWAEQQRREG